MKVELIYGEPVKLKEVHVVCISIWIPGRWPWSKGRKICRECGREM